MTTGSHKTSRRRGRPYTSKSIQQAYKKSERISQDGDEWVAPRLASKIASKHRDTIGNWTMSCPWKNGKPLISRPFPSTNGRVISYILESDLNRVVTAIAKASEAPSVDKAVHVGAAREILDVSADTVRLRFKRFKKNNPRAEALVNKGKRYVSRAGKKRPDQWGATRRYVPNEFVEHDRALRKGSNLRDGKASAEEAAKYLGTSLGNIHAMVRLGKLTREKAEVPNSNGSLRQMLRISWEELRKLKPEKAAVLDLDQAPEPKKTENPQIQRKKRNLGGRPRGTSKHIVERDRQLIEKARSGEFASAGQAARQCQPKLDKSYVAKLFRRSGLTPDKVRKLHIEKQKGGN